MGIFSKYRFLFWLLDIPYPFTIHIAAIKTFFVVYDENYMVLILSTILGSVAFFATVFEITVPMALSVDC